MRRTAKRVCSLAAGGLVVLALAQPLAARPGADAGAPATAATAAPAIVSRIQVLYDPVSRSVSRQKVSVVDPHPELKLEFLWEPASGNWPGVDAEGLASGPGVLTWRVPGTASYDPRAVHDRFEGTLKAGAYDGPGLLTRRDGSRWEGTWVAGLMEGDGSHRDAEGNLYEGPFHKGLAEGTGTWRSREGWIYTGGFRAGLRDGSGEITLPGGQRYEVVMRRGVEMSSTRPAEITDSTLAGLLPAQGGGSAGKVSISVVTDQRIAQNQGVPYIHYLGDGALQIYPQDEHLAAAWAGNGTAQVPYQFLENTRQDWQDTRAFLSIDLATDDASRVRIESLKLAVDYSEPHLRPMLSVAEHQGCIGTQPDFEMTNYGWGPVENPRLRVRFANPDTLNYENIPATPATAAYDVPISGFDQGTDVDLRDVLTRAGVDLATLSGHRFTCPSYDDLDRCRANLIASVPMGELTGFVGGGSNLQTVALGELTYDWTDARGEVQTLTETFHTYINLARIELPDMMAEMGAGGPYATQAPQFQEIKLRDQGTDYAIDLPIRGNPNISTLRAQVQLWAERSSLHAMHVEATFADGSIRNSLPIYLFYISPRTPEFVSSIRPGACF
ncbi:MORN repeat-containing protein [Frigidibacter sp. ROC022]|uniref:MORN repeat-containing protein n=1 Tax=Frigidibacter sp. ROC022 TaxID=2971796 RepID=UPI00215ABF79|nr:hypothetical protein [Frigidibacter sp. ROC022]MCR8723814.1 hypothetical protein [Frigidibacter sp. ROC022]